MRLDQFLANAGCIPRRTQAKQACDEGLVEVDGKVARPATSVQVGQLQQFHKYLIEQVILRVGLLKCMEDLISGTFHGRNTILPFDILPCNIRQACIVMFHLAFGPGFFLLKFIKFPESNDMRRFQRFL